MTGVFIDTSAWYAAANDLSRDHGPTVRALRAHRQWLITSNFIVDETITLIRSRLGWQAARIFGNEVRGGKLARLVPVELQDEDAAWDIFVRYHDHAFSFTDCTSFAVMQRLGLATAITLDSDFRTFGLRCLP